MPNPNGPVFDPTAYSVKSPLGLPPFEDAVNNPMTLEGVALGRKLFFDPILSADSTLSCSGCHGITTGLVDGNNAVSIGIDGIPGTRNSMPGKGRQLLEQQSIDTEAGMLSGISQKHNMRSSPCRFTEFCNSQCLSHFAAPFIVDRTETSIAESCELVMASAIDNGRLQIAMQ